MVDAASSNTNLNDGHPNRDLSRLESKMGVTEQDNINSSMSAEDAVVTEMILATERVQKALMANNASDGDECDKQRADSNESSVPQPTSRVNSSPIQLSTESPIDQQQSQVSPPTTVNHQQQLREKKHIMISYNRTTCKLICDKIENGLQEKGYTVWRDTRCLHGNILHGMAKAIENSFIVLLCMNTKYQESKYCMAEAEYTFEKNVPYIPCVMEEGFKPSGGLAILKRARNRISFFPPENFDRSFAELATEIEYIEAELNEKCHENLSDRINAIISDYKSSINKSHLQLQHLTKKELFKLMERFCKEIAPETSQIFQNENSYNNDDNSIQNQEEFYHWIMKYLLKQDERLTAVIRTPQEQEKNFAAVTQCLLHHNDEMKTSSIYLSPSLD
ncbi:unnamed protein product [Rotaria sordida]|uniref:TIR domain-containing protein n=1 Tax=Rotaria sordida TaxID=392033 RepID=A0A815H506_9BILA|nr:unnamed protein product [Rotaria sordida]